MNGWRNTYLNLKIDQKKNKTCQITGRWRMFKLYNGTIGACALFLIWQIFETNPGHMCNVYTRYTWLNIYENILIFHQDLIILKHLNILVLKGVREKICYLVYHVYIPT